MNEPVSPVRKNESSHPEFSPSEERAWRRGPSNTLRTPMPSHRFRAFGVCGGCAPSMGGPSKRRPPTDRGLGFFFWLHTGSHDADDDDDDRSRGLCCVPRPAVMKTHVQPVAPTSALCQTPGGLIAYSPAAKATLRTAPPGRSWSSVMLPAVQTTTSCPLGWTSQTSHDSENVYIDTSRPSAPSAACRAPYAAYQSSPENAGS
mmetsp:Transcript_14838/g.59424  ORF Transcript_14838/g.59424 Transcript_14838/m.59424 type:complete len:203 (+) Transcript_14838:1013-1621(+)